MSKVTVDSRTLAALIKAVQCSVALDLPYRRGADILKEHGFNEEDRFETPASEYVRALQDDALDCVVLYEKTGEE